MGRWHSSWPDLAIHLAYALPHPLEVFLPQRHFTICTAHSENVTRKRPRDPPDDRREFARYCRERSVSFLVQGERETDLRLELVYLPLVLPSLCSGSASSSPMASWHYPSSRSRRFCPTTNKGESLYERMSVQSSAHLTRARDITPRQANIWRPRYIPYPISVSLQDFLFHPRPTLFIKRPYLDQIVAPCTCKPFDWSRLRCGRIGRAGTWCRRGY